MKKIITLVLTVFSTITFFNTTKLGASSITVKIKQGSTVHNLSGLEYDNQFTMYISGGVVTLMNVDNYIVLNPGQLQIEIQPDNAKLVFESNGIAQEIIGLKIDNNFILSIGEGEASISNVDNFITLQEGNVVVRVSTIDNKRPAISGEENFVTNVDDAKPLSFFQGFISAYDETDGVVPIYVISDNYTANMSVLGTHKVVFGAKDNSDNEATLEVYIRVVDITKPVITGNSSIVSVGYKETWSISNFQSTLQVSDNYDTLKNSDIYVKTDNYTSNKNKLGTYDVIYAVKDQSNNEGTFTKQVKVIDNVKPTFSGPATIHTSNNTILTESDVRAELTAFDEIDGNITNKIVLVEDNYSGKGNKVGTYTIKYSVTDNAGNSETHIVSIIRSDKIPPVFWIEDGVSIKTTPTTPLNIDQIILILEETGQITINATTQFNVLFDDYTGNEATPGIYTMSLKARSANGNESIHNLSIRVLDVVDENPIEVIPGLDIIEWMKDNKTTVIIVGLILLSGVAVFIVRKRK